MNTVYHFFETILNFMSQGGWVLNWIFCTVFVLWFLAIERFWYLHFSFKKDSQKILNNWKNFSFTNIHQIDRGRSEFSEPSSLEEKKPAQENSPQSHRSPQSRISSQSRAKKNILFSKIRKAELSSLNMLLNKHIFLIKTLVALCPLLGLLGTVTGMIYVFEIMSAVGTGNARLMASGVSRATIPTMAGMVGALSGIYISRVLENRVNKEKQKLSHSLMEIEINEKNH